MADLTFPVGRDGLLLSVLVGLDRRASRARVARGGTFPLPALVRAAIDTGSDLTAVSAPVLTALGARPGRGVQTHTAGGFIPTPTYHISLSIPPAVGSAPMLTFPQLRVTQLMVALPNVELLIGLDVILQHELHIYGPGRTFTLTF